MADNLTIRISAEDQATPTLDRYVRALGNAKAAQESTAASLGTLTAAFGLGQISAETFTRALDTVVRGSWQLVQSIDAAEDSIRTMTGATGAALDELQNTARATLGTVTQGIGELTATQNQLAVRLGLTGTALQDA